MFDRGLNLSWACLLMWVAWLLAVVLIGVGWATGVIYVGHAGLVSAAVAATLVVRLDNERTREVVRAVHREEGLRSLS